MRLHKRNGNYGAGGRLFTKQVHYIQPKDGVKNVF